MAAAIRTSIVILLALAIAGGIGSWAAGGFFSARGSLGPTVLQSQSPVYALAGVVLTVCIVAVLGGFLSRLTSVLTGMFLVGFALFAMTLQLQGATEFVLSEGNIYILITESVVIALVVLVGGMIVFAIGGPLGDVQQVEEGQQPSARISDTLFIAIAIIPVVYLIATTPEKGQVIGATAVGGLAIGFLVRICTPTLQPVFIFAIPTAIGGAGYFIAMMMGPVDDIALVQQSISPLLYPMPLDYAAGSVMGISIGLSWAASFAKPKEVEQAKSHT